MPASLVGADFISVLESNFFGYLLHALELAAAEILFSVYLPKRKYFPLRIVLFVIVLCGASLGLGMLFERYFPYFRFLAAFIVSLALFPLCYKTSAWDELFCCVAAVAVQNLAYSAGGFVVGAFGWDPMAVHPLYSSIFVCVYCLIHVLCFLVCARKLKGLDGGFGKERIPMLILLFILSVIVYIIQHDRQSLAATDFLWWRAMFICYDILALYLLFGMQDRSRLRHENAILDSLCLREQQQYEFDRRAIEMVNIKCHDLKHRLIALQDKEGAERDEALRDIEDAVMIYDAIAKTGCKPLDAILPNKLLFCEKYGIRFTYIVDGKSLSFLAAADIYSLFGNAIDNAIKAEIAVPEQEKRLIHMTVRARGNFLCIHIENYFTGELRMRDGLPVTTQKDETLHGFGMISMKRIAEKYGGVMSVGVANAMFCVDFTIPIANTS